MKPIKNLIACESAKWEFKCPKSWDSLVATSRKGVRYCEDCRQQVYLCTGVEQVNRRARRGQCIAWQASYEPDEVLVTAVGRIETPYEVSETAPTKRN